MNKNQQAQALVTYFIDAYKKANGFNIGTINRYKVKWGMVDVIDSVGYTKAKDLIDYYMTCDAKHTFEEFYNSFDRLDEMEATAREDAARRARLRRETKERMERLEQR
jgi:hypothetical protein